MAAAEAEVASPPIADAASDAAETAAVVAAWTSSPAQVSKAALAAKLLSLSGVFAVHKPKGPTSAELLNRLKEKLLAEAGMPSPEWHKRQKQTLKIGHGGTLDSAAQGVLVVGIGRGTKMLTSMLSGSKRYIATGELGKATDTLDSTGKVTDEKPYDKITQEDIEGVLQKFTGNIMQVPPLYSALKKDGQRLSTLMKRGEAVEARPARPVTVYSISLLRFQPPLFTLARSWQSGNWGTDKPDAMLQRPEPSTSISATTPLKQPKKARDPALAQRLLLQTYTCLGKLNANSKSGSKPVLHSLFWEEII
ncbi:pseudouridylate synthase TRUB1 isoform X2 [Microtus pennsylvanicus]|uniref:pseudouridylate synthase TRUB1 isoform X2 n=1 Tax=Microtus pennsylvanicus TaxID=10058 RepID=UPI003F6D37B4